MRPAFSDEASTRSTRQPEGLSGGDPEVRLPVGGCRTLEKARVPTNRTAKARAIAVARRSFIVFPPFWRITARAWKRTLSRTKREKAHRVRMPVLIAAE